jgi:glyoxylate reductase
VLGLLPDLRLVANYGAGIDGIDLRECAARGIDVTSTPGVLDSAVADLTMGLMIACRRRIVESDTSMRRGEWPATDVAVFLGGEISGCHLGIIGFGGIGRAVARRARAFEMKISYAQRSRLEPSDERELGVSFQSIDALVSESDVVSLHVPLTNATDRLLNAERLASMKTGACLVNTSRGAVVDEDALVAELVRGRLSAGLDVYVHEPSVPRMLLGLTNVVLTSHIGSATLDTRVAMTELMVANIMAAAAGDPLLTPVLTN